MSASSDVLSALAGPDSSQPNNFVEQSSQNTAPSDTTAPAPSADQQPAQPQQNAAPQAKQPSDFPPSPDESGASVVSQDSQSQQPHSLFRSIVMGALGGVASHLKGAGEGLMMGGIPGAVVGGVNPKMAQQTLDNRRAVAQAAVQQKQAQAQSAQYQAQNAQEQMAMNQVHLLEAQREYNMLPKTQQEAFDRQHESQLRDLYNTAVDSGHASEVQNFGNWNDDAHWQSYQALHEKYIRYGDDQPFNFVPAVNPNGDLVMLKIHDESRGIRDDKTIDTGVKKSDGSPATLTIPAGTPWADFHKIVLNSQIDDLKSQRKISESQQTGVTAKNQAAANKSNAQATQNVSAIPNADVLGFTPTIKDTKEYNKRQDSFKKNLDDLSKTESTFDQFNNVLGDINAGKDITGAQSVVTLFNAIGLSATPLKGQGFRINSNTIQEHAEARGLGQSLYQKLLKLQNGDVITPQQIKDYASIAQQARVSQYVHLVNEAHNDGLNADFILPAGNGAKIDPSTAAIFLKLSGGDKNKARAAAQKKGWNL